MIANTCNTCKGLGTIEEEDLCNMCGKSSYRHGSRYGNEHCYEGGYYSTELDDGVIYNYIICESCLANLFQQFKIPVKKI